MDRNLSQSEISARRRRTLLKYGGIVAAVVAIGWVAIRCSGSAVSEKDLTFSTVDVGDLDTSVLASGRVAAASEEVITSPVSSRLLEVYRRVGDEVEAGTPLVRLDLEATRNDYQSQADQLAMMRLELERLQAQNATTLNELEMQIRLGEMKLQRLDSELANERYLDSIGGGTTEQVNKVAYERQSATLDLDRMRKKLVNEQRIMSANERSKQLDIEIKSRQLALTARQLSQAEICAPRRATITSIVTDIGSTISTGQVMATIADLGHYRIDGEVNDNYGRNVRPGDRAMVRVANQRLDGTISNVTPTSTNGLYGFSVALDNDSAAGLRPGLKPDIYIYRDVRSQVRRIANGPFYSEPGAYSLFVDAGDGRLERRDVKLGAANYDYVEVISGLNPGDRVVVSDMKQYSENQTLQLK